MVLHNSIHIHVVQSIYVPACAVTAAHLAIGGTKAIAKFFTKTLSWILYKGQEKFCLNHGTVKNSTKT